MENIGAKFKEIREKRGYSQTQLKEKLGVSKSYISQIENDKKRPTIEFLNRVAIILNVDVADFFTEKMKIPEELDVDGLKWVIFGEEMKKEGFTIDQIKEWVRVIKATENK